METVTTQKLMEDIKVVMHDAEELLKATAGQAGEKIGAARARAEASLRAAKERLAELQDGALEYGRKAAGQADDYVRSNPWQSIGFAAAAGLLIGILISRK